MPLKPASTLVIARTPVVDPQTGMATREFVKKLQEYEQKLQNGLDTLGKLVGVISSSTSIEGRSERIAVTVGHITAAGQVDSLTNVAADRNLDHIDDSASWKRTNPNQVTGAGRAYNALDANSKLPGSSATPNMQLNSVNFATVAGVDLGATAGALIYGTGGPGTQWTAQVGTLTTGPYPAGSISGLAYSTDYVCYYDTIGTVYVATIAIPDGLNDYFVYVGTFKTPAPGGAAVPTFSISMAGVAPNQTVDTVLVLTGGSFTGTPTAVFSGGGSPTRQAAGYFVMSGGAIAGFVKTDPGAGYSSAPTLSAAGATSGVTGGGGASGGVGGRGSLAGLTA